MFGYEDYFGGGGGGGRGGARRSFENCYQCFSMAVINKSHLDDGDKILLPPSALDTLSRMNVTYPMLFEIKNDSKQKSTHVGVIEFSAEEGKCHIPYFIMKNLLLEEGSIITIKNISLPKCTFLKVRAQSMDFLDISNPRAVLEYTLRKYTCVTEGDVIVLSHLDKFYHMDVLEVKPLGAASIVETDLEIDFAEPVGYKESEYARKYDKKASSFGTTDGKEDHTISTKPLTFQKARSDADEASAQPKFTPFTGTGKRIDGKPTSTSNTTSSAAASAAASVEVKGTSSTANTTTATASAAVSKSSISLTGGGLSLTSSSSASSAVPPTANTTSNTTVPGYTSKIGDKFSKKKVAASAFTGTAHKLV